MNDLTIDEQFRRWRQGRDPADLASVFDRTAPSLLRLARHLAPRGVEAEDLVQATFLKALEAPESWDAAKPLVPWLAGILGHCARHEGRRVARVPDVGRLRVPTGHDPVTASVENETTELLESALARVPERYRAVLEGRLVRESTAPDLAADLGRAPSTVHVQYHRGLRLLRRVLPAGLTAGVSGATESGVALAAVRRRVLRAARGEFAAPMAASLAWLVTVGGVAAALTVAVVLSTRAEPLVSDALADDLLERAAWSADSEDGAEVADAEPAVLPRPKGRVAQERGSVSFDEVVPPSSAPLSAVAAPGGPSPIRWWVVGRVLAPAGIDHGDKAWEGTKVRIDGPGVGMEFGVVRRDGTFRQAMLSPPPWSPDRADMRAPDVPLEMTFAVSHPDYLTTRCAVAFDQRVGDTVTVELELGAAGRIRGRAVDEAQNDLPACFTQVYPLGSEGFGGPAVADRGMRFPSSYDLLAAPGESVAVVGLGGLRPAGVEILVLEGGVHDLETVVLEGGATLSGLLRRPFDVGASVDARLVGARSGQRLGPLEVAWFNGRVEWSLARATVAPGGGFEFMGLVPGARYLLTCGDRSVEAVAGRGGIVL